MKKLVSAVTIAALTTAVQIDTAINGGDAKDYNATATKMAVRVPLVFRVTL